VTAQEAKTNLLGDMWETRSRLEDEVKTLKDRLDGAYAQNSIHETDIKEKTEKIMKLEVFLYPDHFFRARAVPCLCE